MPHSQPTKESNIIEKCTTIRAQKKPIRVEEERGRIVIGWFLVRGTKRPLRPVKIGEAGTCRDSSWWQWFECRQLGREGGPDRITGKSKDPYQRVFGGGIPYCV